MTTTRKQFERRAGLRFGYLVRQLIDDGWKAVQISEATGIDPKLISTWLSRVMNPTLPYDASRNGISDQTIQGIHDGLGVQANFLFMSAKGQPNTVVLKDGSERPCDPDELDHKRYKVADLDAAREKRDVATLKKRADAADERADRMERKLDMLLAALSVQQDDKRNAR